jgi:hypothetical protein
MEISLVRLSRALILVMVIGACAPAVSVITPSPGAVSPAVARTERPILVGIPTSRWGERFNGAARAFRADGTVDSSVALEGMFAAWSPDGQSIAHMGPALPTGVLLHIRTDAGRDDTIRVASVVTDSKGAFASWPMWSPRGDAIGIILSDMSSSLRWTPEFVVLDVNPLRVRRRYRIPEGFNQIVPLPVPDQAAWSPSGASVLLMWGGKAVIIDLETGLLDGVPETVAAAAWMPDGRSIGFLSNHTLLRFRINGFFVRQVDAVQPSLRTSVRLADSAAIAAAGIRQFQNFFGSPATMERSPSGKRLAIAAGKGDSNVVLIYSTSPSAPVNVTRPAIVINVGKRVPAHLEWSPDENHMAAWMIDDPNSWPRYSVQTIDLRTQALKLVTTVPFGAEENQWGSMLKLLSWSR